MSEEQVHVRAAGAPTRCPFCHADVDREREAWVACLGCLSRHHAGCWTEGHGCAGCGETRSIGGAVEPAPPPASVEGLPRLTVPVRVRTEHRSEIDDRAPLLLRPGTATAFALVVRNDTGEPERVELRRLPAWLHVEGPAQATVAPGASAAFRLEVAADLVPDAALKRARGFLGNKGGPADGAPTGTLTVSSDDDVRTVGLFLARATPRRTLLGIGALAGIWVWPLAPVVFVACLWMLATTALAASRVPATDDLEAVFEHENARENRRAALTILAAQLAVLVPLLSAIFLTK